MAQLPRGTVTLLFSDIEGSTRLLQDLGPARYARALQDHRRLLRDVFSSHGGVEVGTEGDSFFVAFPQARDAVVAASKAQAALEAHQWEDGAIRVRMGVHTGEPALDDEGYVGIDVHRAARVMSAGHGGQVLLTEATRAVIDTLPDGIEVRDLGSHRLKDLSAPVRLYQLGDATYPALATLSQTNLPVQPSPLVGRERELREGRELLSRHRVVTLVGAGGTGKTRLALQLAADSAESFGDGVWWVPLAALNDADLVEPAIAHAVGARRPLSEHLRQRRALLLLDNFEHVLDAAPVVARLVEEAPELRVLVTSRAPLRIAAEQQCPVPPLDREDAVALFVERARAVSPSFTDDDGVTTICERLDCLPLALELAAARVRVLPPDVMLERLESRLPLLTKGSRDAPVRQRTLEATLEWSYALLDKGEQTLFARLAVFAGGFDIAAAESVVAADVDTIESLLEKSLLRETGDGRFSMLETIREYAAAKLAEAGDGEVRLRHLEHFASVAEELGDELFFERARLERLERDHDNFRAALAFGLAFDHVELAMRLAGALRFFWWAHSHIAEGRRWIEATLLRGVDVPPDVRARALSGASYFACIEGDFERARACADENLRYFRSTGDARGVNMSLNELGNAAVQAGDLASAKRYYTEIGRLEEFGEGARPSSVTMSNLGNVALLERDYDEADRLYREGLALATQEHYEIGVAFALAGLGAADLARGRVESARRELLSALDHFVEHGFLEGVCDAVEPLAVIALESGDVALGLRLAGFALETRRVLGLEHIVQAIDWTDRIRSASAELADEDADAILDVGRRMELRDVVADARSGLGGALRQPADSTSSGPANDGVIRRETPGALPR
jgi:predicted ATPase/class 3 adenylate cyclase